MMTEPGPDTGHRAVVDTEVTAFLFDESAALDEHRPADWLDLLTDDFEYFIPLIEVYEEPDQSPYHEHAFLDRESKGSMQLKLMREESEFAWAQRPGGFLRHLVGNVRVLDEHDTEQGTELEVRSNVLVSWTRDPEPAQLFSAGRIDRIRRTPDGLRLARRRVHLDTATPSAAQVWIVY